MKIIKIEDYARLFRRVGKLDWMSPEVLEAQLWGMRYKLHKQRAEAIIKKFEFKEPDKDDKT